MSGPEETLEEKMLPVEYDPVLVVTSILVAIMASFTALRLTTGLNALEPAARKPIIAQAAIALGGGIWSMHFVGMLAVELPIGITYDALPTLLSALLAILVTGIGLMLLHFGTRTRTKIFLAGSIAGLGIVGMHYLGMQAIRGNCILLYGPAGIVIASLISISTSTAAFYFAYSRRTLKMSAVGGIMLGLAISSMHYSAMAFTIFQSEDGLSVVGEPNLSSGMLALIVSLAAFLICGLFLLNVVPTQLAPPAAASIDEEPVSPSPGKPFTSTEEKDASEVTAKSPSVAPLRDVPADAHEELLTQSPSPSSRSGRDVALSKAFGDTDQGGQTEKPRRIPYERDNTIRFFTPSHIWAVQADGHYARVINHDGEHFCPWSLSKVEEVLACPSFLRTHRSYLVNLDHVAGFKKDGDKGFCLFGTEKTIEVPVSRSQMSSVRKALDLV